MDKQAPVYVIAAKRTPVGKAPRGVFSRVRPDDLLSHVLAAVVADVPALDLADISDVIIGCAMPEAEQGMNVARIASLLAGLPDSVPAMTINRFCSSGLQAIALAAQRIAAGDAELMMAGGVESMSMVPMGGHQFSANPRCFTPNEEHVAIAFGMGITAEKVAKRWSISREAQDQFALQSHHRAVAAIQAGEFEEEISAFTVSSGLPKLGTGEMSTRVQTVKQDEGPRADTTLAAIEKLPSVFAARGTVTAANSSQMSDGAAALLLASERQVKVLGIEPLARFQGFDVAGLPPEIMGVGPVYAIPKVLKKAGLTLSDVDWIELNEAFAAQSLAVIQELQLDPKKVNPLGGAIALGHPLGATGAIRAATCIYGLKRRQLKCGMVTMCIGTGMGAAGLFIR